ncbi:MAG: hypothetical protein IPH31_18740 [Lewinellaceae bacterium]|nr:hypothetical protein [Lewinellaceae bacterium]
MSRIISLNLSGWGIIPFRGIPVNPFTVALEYLQLVVDLRCKIDGVKTFGFEMPDGAFSPVENRNRFQSPLTW